MRLASLVTKQVSHSHSNRAVVENSKKKTYQRVKQQYFDYVIHLNPLNTKTSSVSRRDVIYTG